MNWTISRGRKPVLVAMLLLVLAWATWWLTGVWQEFKGGEEPANDDPKTGLPAQRLSDLLTRLAHLPEGFHLHKTLQRGIEQRLAMAGGKRPLDWAAGEAGPSGGGGINALMR